MLVFDVGCSAVVGFVCYFCVVCSLLLGCWRFVVLVFGVCCSLCVVRCSLIVVGYSSFPPFLCVCVVCVVFVDC